MAVDEKKAAGGASTQPAGGPLSPAARQRLQRLFEHASQSAQKKDFDYAHELFTQCVAGDPASTLYLQSMLDNLKTKYNNNKKGGKLAGMKTSAGRKNMKAAAGKQDWPGVIRAGCEVLRHNPWDPPALMGMADACDHLGIDECQLYYLKWALNADPKNPEVNKKAARTLSRMGQFDQAIACWHRVEEAKPGDQEAANEISRLTVEKAVHHGGYSREVIEGKPKGSGSSRSSGGSDAARDSRPAAGEPQPKLSREQFLREKIEKDPSDLPSYFELAKLYEAEHDFDRAEQMLQQASAASGGGDLSVRERMEDLQMRRARHQLAIAQKRASSDPGDEAKTLVQRIRSQVNQQELEIYAARADREPKKAEWKYELGVRLKLVGKFRQGLETLQAVEKDRKLRPAVLLEIGECYQHLEEYDRALARYRSAIEAAGKDKEAAETKKRALYRAGVLSTGLRELDQAESFLKDLADLDPEYRDVSARLDKIERLRHKE
jgi:tetratricopeptide (TPR) repeat protein